jgi:hypothetical protein
VDETAGVSERRRDDVKVERKKRRGEETKMLQRTEGYAVVIEPVWVCI